LEALLGKTPQELKDIAKSLDLPGFTGDQLAAWLYQSSITSWDEMTNISKKNRDLLASKFETGFDPSVKVQTSADGTKKYLYPALQNKFIETAYIPEETRATLCVSTQVGCKMGCLFCNTAKQGFQGNLTTAEIINQLRSLPEMEKVTNLVFMGMGEPFDNTDATLRACEVFVAEWGFNLSIRKVTVSTIGIVPGMELFLKNTKCNLAVSLHSPFDEERRKLMPVQHVYPIKEVIGAIETFNTNRSRKIFIEYILFKGINDTQRHVKEMARLLNRIKCRVNLMHYHAVPGIPLEGADEESLKAFQKGLNEKGIIATIRQSRGLDIDAACGLLSTKEMVRRDGVMT
jgi:23S rRNA (adenine2503-C2)-methyltransferase